MRCLRVGDGVVGDRARHVEDAVAAGDGRRQAAAVQQVGPEQPQPLAGAVQRRQVRVLGVACTQIDRESITGRHMRELDRSTMFVHKNKKNSIDRQQKLLLDYIYPWLKSLSRCVSRKVTGIADGAVDRVPAGGEEALDEPRAHEAPRAGHAHRHRRRHCCATQELRRRCLCLKTIDFTFFSSISAYGY